MGFNQGRVSALRFRGRGLQEPGIIKRSRKKIVVVGDIADRSRDRERVPDIKISSIRRMRRRSDYDTVDILRPWYPFFKL